MPQPDVIRRFAETPLETILGLSGINIRLKTNCQPLADQLRRALTPFPASSLDTPDFTLRVVAESEDDPELEVHPTVHHLSHDGLSFISLGRNSFLACDRQARQGISFVSRNLLTDEAQFNRCFLPALIQLLKESIGVQS
jgi:hypothetical protein